LLALTSILLAAPVAFAQRSTPVTLIDPMLVEVQADVRSGVQPLDVFFSSQLQGGAAPVAYAWDFGDGSSSSTPSAYHQYAFPGSFRAVLTVIDQEGRAAQASIDVQVDADLAPACEILPETTVGIEPLVVRFDSTVASGNPPLTYSWWVDGIPQASTPTTILSFTTPNTYTVELHVTDADGDTDVDSATVFAQEDRPVVVQATASSSGGTAPLHVDFGSSVIDGNAPFAFHWEFGEGSSSSLKDPSLLFSQPGDYAVTVRVTDADGDVDSATLFVLVTP
jgi:PKD repeat protein